MSARPGTLAQAVQAIQAEAGGLLYLHVICQSDGPRLIAGALSGNREAAQLLLQVSDMLQRIGDSPASSPMRCECCGSDQQAGRFALVIATPEISDPSTGLAHYGDRLRNLAGPRPPPGQPPAGEVSDAE